MEELIDSSFCRIYSKLFFFSFYLDLLVNFGVFVRVLVVVGLGLGSALLL